MKIKIILLMILQVLLFIYGINQICNGNLFLGLFNVILNTAFFIVNVYTLKRIR